MVSFGVPTWGSQAVSSKNIILFSVGHIKKTRNYINYGSFWLKRIVYFFAARALSKYCPASSGSPYPLKTINPSGSIIRVTGIPDTA